MSFPPDASDISAPKDPADYRPRPLLGVTFWAMLALMFLCVLAGVGVANYGPRLFSPKLAVRAATEGASVAEAAAPPSLPSIALAAPPSVSSPTEPSPDVARLSARVANLEAQQIHASQAAAAALVASAVVEAAQGTGPFAEELSSLRAISPPSAELQALARLAPTGAPSRTALAESYPEYAAHAASAARAPGDKAGLGDRIVYELSRVVSLRHVGDMPGDSVDALLSRAERQVNDGDLDRALHTLDRLPPGARDAMASWRTRAERRAEIDRNASALRVRALQALANEARGGG